MGLGSFFRNLRKAKKRSSTLSTLPRDMFPQHKSLEDHLRDQRRYGYLQLEQLAKAVPDIQSTIRVIIQETFGRGAEWKEKFAKKCVQCEQEYDKEVEECVQCGGTDFREPDPAQKVAAEQFFKKVNEYGQSMMAVFRRSQEDILIVDDAFLLLAKRYTFVEAEDGTSYLDRQRVAAIERLSPDIIRLNLDEQTGRFKENERFCPAHRSAHTPKKYCEECRRETFKARYVVDSEGETLYYAGDEIIHWPFFSESETYGWPPIYSIWQQAHTELGMDKELFLRYYGNVLPKSILALAANMSEEDLTKLNDRMIKAAQAGEQPIMQYDPGTSRGKAELIRLTDDNINDLVNKEAREVLLRSILKVFGVTPLYSAQVERGSALSGEGQQLQVMAATTIAHQNCYHEKVLPKLLDALGVTDWLYMLVAPDEESEEQEVNLKIKKAQHAAIMVNMGFTASLDEDGEIAITGEGKRQEQPGGFGEFTPEAPTAQTPAMPGLEESVKSLKKRRPTKAEKAQKKIYEQYRTKLRKAWKPIIATHVAKWGRRRPSLIQIKAMTKEVMSKVKGVTTAYFDDAYRFGLGALGKELGIKFDLAGIDYNTIKYLERSKPLVQAFSKMSTTLSTGLYGVVKEHLKRPGVFSLDAMVKDMGKKARDVSEGRLERIARNESHNISVKARRNGYRKADPKGEWRYEWIGPTDHRTTEYCKKIKAEIARIGRNKGVPLQTLKELTKRLGDPKTARSYLPHIQCRHSMARVV